MSPFPFHQLDIHSLREAPNIPTLRLYCRFLLSRIELLKHDWMMRVDSLWSTEVERVYRFVEGYTASRVGNRLVAEKIVKKGEESLQVSDTLMRTLLFLDEVLCEL